MSTQELGRRVRRRRLLAGRARRQSVARAAAPGPCIGKRVAKGRPLPTPVSASSERLRRC